MKCEITFDNGSPGGCFLSTGELEISDNSFALNYETDWDKCFLSYSDGKVFNRRRGIVALDMRFSEGEETACSLGDDGLCGTFPVYTNKILLAKTGGRINLKLIYNIGGEDFTLEITAAVIQEKR